MKSKEHLTIEGLAKIEEIKSNTNTKRIYLVSNSTNIIDGAKAHAFASQQQKHGVAPCFACFALICFAS
jgi:hypothetical protein